ncbi:MAG: hypothetical protein ACM3ML_05190 [Micromonosporaceae bacterium]
MIRYCLAIEPGDPGVPADFKRALESLDGLDARAERPEVVYLWADHTITTVPLHDAEPVYAPDGDEWHKMCAEILGAHSRPPE